MATIRDITMYEDVGFDATHKHCIDFPSETDRDNYFSNLRDKTFFRDANYNKVDNMLNLECEWETGLKFSYCSLVYGNKKMFFFVTGCKVINEKVTGFELVMDMWQTFLFDFTVGEGMITREHVDRWDAQGNILWRKGVNEDSVVNYQFNTSQNLVQREFYVDNEKHLKFYLGGMLITHLKSDIKETEEIKHSVYETYFFPVVNVVSENDEKYFVKMLKYKYTVIDPETQERITTIKELVAPTTVLSGDCFTNLDIDPKSVIGICYIPIIPENETHPLIVEYSGYPTANVVEITINEELTIFSSFPNKVYTKNQPSWHPDTRLYFSDFDHSYISVPDDIYRPKTKTPIYKLQNLTLAKPIKPINNDTYSPTHEPELFKSPYIIRSLSNIDGSIISEINDNCWMDNRNLFVTNLLKDNQSVDLAYCFYNGDSDVEISSKEFSSLANRGLMFKISGNQIDVPSDEWKSYVISSRDTDRQMLQSTINQQAITSSIGAIVGMGGISGMAGSGKTGGLGFNPYQAMAGAGIGAVMGVAGYFANNHFGWEQQEIKERGIRNQPNNLLRSATGDGILKNIYPFHTYNELKCNDSVYNQASKRYHKFGYRVDMMDVPNIRTRKYFNFVQTTQIKIDGSMNQAIRDGIANIFNNGVTIWHGEYITKESGTNKFITDYSKENIERSLI